MFDCLCSQKHKNLGRQKVSGQLPRILFENNKGYKSYKYHVIIKCRHGYLWPFYSKVIVEVYSINSRARSGYTTLFQAHCQQMQVLEMPCPYLVVIVIKYKFCHLTWDVTHFPHHQNFQDGGKSYRNFLTKLRKIWNFAFQKMNYLTKNSGWISKRRAITDKKFPKFEYNLGLSICKKFHNFQNGGK